jgi:hypothetical protein
MTSKIYVSGTAQQPYSVAAGLTEINAASFGNYLSSSAGYFNTGG